MNNQKTEVKQVLAGDLLLGTVADGCVHVQVELLEQCYRGSLYIMNYRSSACPRGEILFTLPGNRRLITEYLSLVHTGGHDLEAAKAIINKG